MLKPLEIAHQVGVFLGALAAFVLFVLFTDNVSGITPPALSSHDACESTGRLSCGLVNAAFFGLAGFVVGLVAALIAWRGHRAFFSALVALVVVSVFSVLSTLRGVTIFNVPIFTNFPGTPSWLAVPFPVIFFGIVAFFAARRLIKA
ncbi:MAG: hypothetical protein U5L08_01550 [Xanthomonadales bacterium]|nr:hypothetical protein [Xanthomonadales bacterium]